MYKIHFKKNKISKELKEELIRNYKSQNLTKEIFVEFSDKKKDSLFELLSKNVKIGFEVFEDYSWGKYFLIIENSNYKVINKDEMNEKEVLDHINKLSDESYESVNEYLLINHNDLDLLSLNENEITKKIIDYVVKNNEIYLLTGALTRKFYENGNYIKGEKDLKEKLSQFKKPISNLILLEEYIREVNNGGHDQYFNNSSVYGYRMLLDVLYEMKLYEYKAILEAAVEIFKPSIKRENNCKELSLTKQNFLNSLDKIFYSIDISKIERKYLLNNMKDII